MLTSPSLGPGSSGASADAPLEDALLELSRLESSGTDTALPAAVEVGARALHARGATLWTLEPGGAESARCAVAIGTGAGAPERREGLPLRLRSARVRVEEPADGGVTALEAGLWRNGELCGWLRLERSAPRRWSAAERVFAGALADRVALLLEHSERVRAEERLDEALRVSEARFGAVFQQFPLSIQIFSPDGETLDANREWETLFGLPLERVRGWRPLDDPHFEDLWPLFEQGLAGEALDLPPLLFRTPPSIAGYEASPIWIRAYVRPIHDDRGEVREIMVVHQEVTENRRQEEALQRAYAELEARVQERTAELAEANRSLEAEISERSRAEAALRQRTAELEAVFRALPDMYFRTDSRGVLLDHRFGSQARGYPVPAGLPATLVGHRAEELLPAELRRDWERVLAEVRETGRLGSLEYRMGEDGEARDFEARLLPTDDGSLTAIVRDITDRKAAEAALRTREERFRALIENAHDITCIMDRDGRMLYQSPSSKRVLGYAPEEVVGLNTFDFIHPDDVPGVRRALDEIMATPGVTRAAVYRIRHRDGRWVDLEAFGRTLSPTSADEGLVANVRDISERKRVEEALRESEARYRTLVEQLPAIIYIASMEVGNPTVFTSPHAERLLGYSEREWIETPRLWLERIHVDDRARVEEAWRAAHSAGRRYTAEYRMLTRSGGLVWVRDESMILRNEAGEPLCIQGVMLDITERKRAEEALRFQTTLLEAQSHTSIDGILVAHEGRVLSMNSRYADLFDVPAELRHPGRSDEMFAWASERVAEPEAYRLGIARLRDDPSTVARDEVLLADGRVLDRYSAPLRNADGVAYGRLWMVRDISDRKRTEEAMRAAKEEAERANRAKSEFLSRMSHELRTPMNSILGFAQLLGRTNLPPEHRKSVQHILKAGRHLLHLINEVLEIARIESGRHNLSLEPVRVGPVMQEAIGLVRPLAAQLGVELEEGPWSHEDTFVRADRQRLSQVLLNLLSNAVKYNRPGGRVRLACGPSDPSDAAGPLALRVEDTGRGIPLEWIEELFTPFSRLGAEQTDVEGTGLGLALSQRLAEAMEGSLALERTGPEGSVFRLDLRTEDDPLVRLEEPADPGHLSDETPHAPATILYVEDNLANLSLVETILLAWPRWRIVPALQGQLGVEFAREHAPDLILLDLHLPDIPGAEVLRRLRADERTARTPVVIISADATHDALERLRAAGADAYLTKPLDIDEFLETIQRFLPMAE